MAIGGRLGGVQKSKQFVAYRRYAMYMHAYSYNYVISIVLL